MSEYLSNDPYEGVYGLAEEQQKLRPGLLSAIAQQENVDPRHNNPLGLSTDSGVMSFTPDESVNRILRQAALLNNPNGPYSRFAQTGSIDDLAAVYSPVGASNDIHGTNSTEASGIKAALDKRYVSTDPQAGLVGDEEDTKRQMIEGMKQADQAMKLATLPMNMPPAPEQSDQERMLAGMSQADQAMKLATLPMSLPPPESVGPEFNGTPNLAMLRQGKVMSANQMPMPDASLLYSLGIPQPFAQQEDVPGELGPPNVTALRQGRVEQLPTDKKVKEAFAAIGNLPVDAANFALSPAGLATGAILPQLAPWIQRTVAAGFTAQQAYQAAEAPTLQGKIEALLGAGLGAAGVVKGPEAIEALKSKEEPTATPNVETPNISPARAAENLSPTETSGTLGQVDGPIAPNAEPETGPAPGPAPVGETAQRFTPSTEWQEIPDGLVLPNGGEYRFDQATGKNYARWSAENLPKEPVAEAPQTAPEPAGGIPEPVQPENPVEGQQDAGAATSGEPQTTGVRNKTLEDLAAKGQTDVVPPGTGLSTAELVAKGRSAILNGVDPYEVARTTTKTSAVSPDQFGVLRAHAADLHTRSEALRTEMERNPTPGNKAAFEQAYQDFSKWNKEVVQPAKTRTSDVFRAMQGEEPINAADYTGMREAMEQRIQRGLRPMEETVLKNRAKTVEKVTQRRSQAIDALDKEIKRSSKPTVRIKSMDELRQMVAEKLKSVAPCV